jgi:hypothetical protein
MPLQNAKMRHGVSKRIRTFSAILLLLFYVAGNVQFESFHQVFHSLEKALHSAEAEKDPCHRAIYHDEKENGCDHETHVTAVKNCPLCHVVPFNEQHLASNHTFIVESLLDDDQVYPSSFETEGKFLSTPSRAPPVG